MSAATDLPLDKLQAVVHNPAHRRLADAARLRVFLCPGHHALGSIHMTDLGPRLQAGDGRRAGIGKEVQHADGPAGFTDLCHRPVPVGRLLREKAGVLEVHRLDPEAKLPIMHVPGLRNRPFFPAPSAAFAAKIAGVARLPMTVSARGVPDRLRIRPHQIDLPPAFQFLAVGAVQQFIVLPAVRHPHACFSSHSLSFPAVGRSSS